MMGGWKQKSGWIQIPTASCVPFTFPFLSQLSVCLIVSRVRAYLTPYHSPTILYNIYHYFISIIIIEVHFLLTLTPAPRRTYKIFMRVWQVTTATVRVRVVAVLE
jgi:hypothetical protein